MKKLFIATLFAVTCAVSAQETGFVSAEQSAKEDFEFLQTQEINRLNKIRQELKAAGFSPSRSVEAQCACVLKSKNQAELKKCKL